MDMRSAPPLDWSNRFTTLAQGFYAHQSAAPLPDPHWIAVSEPCAAELGLPPDWWQREDWSALDVISGNATWPGMRPLASVYSGHQFGSWAGQLGDGRALWLGEVQTPAGPWELQLKGSGRTPFSRGGDGRAVLRSTVREFLCSEAMHGLGIPTTRALAMVGSPLRVQRETSETAAIVARAAPSFIRFGHFEHFSHRNQPQHLARLADFTIEHYYPECRAAPQPYAALLQAVALRTAELMAQWQAVGFCHGVMNTDNMSILGLTLDYGPFGFLDAFDPGHVCNHSDDSGRYAYARQPQIGFWNLHALAQAMLPLLGEGDAASEAALAALEPFKATFTDALLAQWRAKLGLREAHDGDRELADDLLRGMAGARADFTITFRRLASFDSAHGAPNDAQRDLFIDREAFDAWALRYAVRLRAEASDDGERAARMNRANPKFVLRNHLAEHAIRQAQAGDFGEVKRLLQVLQRPCDEQPESEADAGFPPVWARELEVSCSS